MASFQPWRPQPSGVPPKFASITDAAAFGLLGGGAILDCSFETTSVAVIVAARGKVDEATWEAFGSHLDNAIQRAVQEKRRMLVINLAGVEYMSSRGLRALTIAKRQADAAGIAITLAAPNEVMREILAISRYDKLFPVTETVEAAS
jgi:anti-anti-sigma factor